GQIGDLVALMRGWQNLRGIVVTVPHKQAFAKHVDTLSARASALAAVNVVRRDRDGGLAGDMADGLGFVNAAREHGFVARGCRGLVVGAGGAGSAIAYALAEAGMASIALHDVDWDRIESLRATIARGFPSVHLERGADTPAGFDLIVNATPIGMDGQSLPLDRGWMQRLEPRTLVADAVTSPAMTPFL